MSVTVIATTTPYEGRRQDILDALEATVPLVHAEPGNEAYAVYTTKETIVVIEKWADMDSLKAHADGEAAAKYKELKGDAAGPAEIVFLRNAGIGDPAKAAI